MVTHYHFSAWPDHGVPADKSCLIHFIKRVRKNHQYYNTPPLVVHCSAGVGRSGTFIVLDSMMQRLTEKVATIDIYDFVCGMRKKRALMVQTEVILDTIQVPNTMLFIILLTGTICIHPWCDRRIYHLWRNSNICNKHEDYSHQTQQDRRHQLRIWRAVWGTVVVKQV